MKRRKNYLHTKFIQFLIESENQRLNDDKVIDDENDDEVIDDENDDEVIDDENDDSADEVIERLVNKLKNTSKEYDDIIYGRKRK
jgi:hypothetical protein